MHTLDTDDILYSILTGSSALKEELTGGIYVLERPNNSGKEDIVINSLILSHEMPQTGTSNINIHVPDLKVKINGIEQYKPNRERLRVLTRLVLDVIKAVKIEGLTIWVSNENIVRETSISEGYNNLRIEWNIQLIN